MKQITIEIPDNKFQFMVDLLSHFTFLRFKKKGKPVSTGTDIEYIDGLKNALNDVELHLKGKKKLQHAKDFLNEI